MAKRLTISFKDTKEEKELYHFLKGKAHIIGASAYIKQLIEEEAKRQGAEVKEGN